MSILLTVPYPLSANRYWRSFVPRGSKRAIVCMSEEARAYKRDVGRLAKVAQVRPLACRVALDVKLYPARPLDWAKRALRDPHGWDDDVRSIDLDNALKVLIDALSGIAYEDDRWVRRILAERMEPDANGARAIISVKQIIRPVHPQADLYAIPPAQALVLEAA